VKATNDVVTAVWRGLAEGDGGYGLHDTFVELGLRHLHIAERNKDVPGTDIPYLNQVGLAYTLLTFSHTPFPPIVRARKTPTDEAVALAWLLMWNVVGSLMGIEAGGLPATLAEAGQLLRLIRESPGYAPVGDDSPRRLTEVLIDEFGGVAMRDTFVTWSGRELMRHLAVIDRI
jgi:hypothetical protein